MIADVLLKLLLTDDSVVRKWGKFVTQSWFDNKVDGIIWREVYRAFHKYGGVPSLDLIKDSVAQRESQKVLEEVELRIVQLSGMEYKSADEGAVKDIVGELVEKTMVEQMLEDGAKAVEVGIPAKVWSIVDETRLILQEISSNGVVPRSILDAGEVVCRYISRAVGEDVVHVGTLIRSLDRVLKGGLRMGTLTVILGVTSVGKTMSMIYLASAFCIQGFTVLYISLEDNKIMINERFDALWFTNSKVNVDSMMHRQKLLARFGGQIYTEYVTDMSVADIKAIVDSYEIRGVHIHCVVVDYGDLMHMDDGKRREEHQEQGDIFEAMMKYGESENKLMITGSQANQKELAKKIVTLRSTGRSFRKAQVAHYVIALCQTQEEEDKNVIRWFVLKNKFGKRYLTIPCEVVRNRQFFRELSGSMDI